MKISAEQKRKLRALYESMIDAYNESDDITDARAYEMYIQGMKDTLLAVGLTMDNLKE